MNTKRYGLEIIVDLHECDISTFQKDSLDVFFIELCILSDMKRVGKPKYWLETSNEPHLKGYSGIQFIKTSSILIHTLDILQSAYINFFSCKDFDDKKVLKFIKKHFKAKKVSYTLIDRV